MIETDFPHQGTYWPYTFDKAKEWFADVSEEQRRKVLRGNAERLFNFHPVKPSVPTADQRNDPCRADRAWGGEMRPFRPYQECTG